MMASHNDLSRFEMVLSTDEKKLNACGIKVGDIVSSKTKVHEGYEFRVEKVFWKRPHSINKFWIALELTVTKQPIEEPFLFAWTPVGEQMANTEHFASQYRVMKLAGEASDAH